MSENKSRLDVILNDVLEKFDAELVRESISEAKKLGYEQAIRDHVCGPASELTQGECCGAECAEPETAKIVAVFGYTDECEEGCFRVLSSSRGGYAFERLVSNRDSQHNRTDFWCRDSVTPDDIARALCDLIERNQQVLI